MFQLLTSPSRRRTARAVLNTVADAVRSVIAPATLVEARATETAEAPAPAGLYTEDELPTEAEIAAAARTYSRAVEDARRADRSKRAGKKLLSRLPSGVYNGGWKIYRKPSARMTPDLEAIGRILREHGIREIPMKPCADSLVVERIEVAVEVPAAAELVAA